MTARTERKQRAALRREGWAGGRVRALDIRQGDTVEVIAGKDKGKRGVVERALPDQQRIAETRPLSKEKRWRIAAVLEKAK